MQLLYIYTYLAKIYTPAPKKIRDFLGKFRENYLKKHVLQKHKIIEMIECIRCKKKFRDLYNLTSHQSRKNKCLEIITTKNIFQTENTCSKTENTCIQTENTCSKTENTCSKTENTCKWCIKCFSRKNNKNVHEKTCKLNNDPIRLLEIEAGIHLLYSTGCRFCKNKKCK